MVESQSLDRIHRMGQERDVVNIRYIVKDSIEEVRWGSHRLWIDQPLTGIKYIQERQSKKLKLAELSFSQNSQGQWAVC